MVFKLTYDFINFNDLAPAKAEAKTPGSWMLRRSTRLQLFTHVGRADDVLNASQRGLAPGGPMRSNRFFLLWGLVPWVEGLV